MASKVGLALRYLVFVISFWAQTSSAALNEISDQQIQVYELEVGGAKLYMKIKGAYYDNDRELLEFNFSYQPDPSNKKTAHSFGDVPIDLGIQDVDLTELTFLTPEQRETLRESNGHLEAEYRTDLLGTFVIKPKLDKLPFEAITASHRGVSFQEKVLPESQKSWLGRFFSNTRFRTKFFQARSYILNLRKDRVVDSTRFKRMTEALEILPQDTVLKLELNATSFSATLWLSLDESGHYRVQKLEGLTQKAQQFPTMLTRVKSLTQDTNELNFILADAKGGEQVIRLFQDKDHSLRAQLNEIEILSVNAWATQESPLLKSLVPMERERFEERPRKKVASSLNREGELRLKARLEYSMNNSETEAALQIVNYLSQKRDEMTFYEATEQARELWKTAPIQKDSLAWNFIRSSLWTVYSQPYSFKPKASVRCELFFD